MPRFKRTADSTNAPPAKKQKLTSDDQAESSTISTMVTTPANLPETIIPPQQNITLKSADYYGRRLLNLRGELVDAPGPDIVTYDYWRDNRLINGAVDQLEFLLLNTTSNELITFRPQSKEMPALREFLKNNPDIRPLMKSDLNMFKGSILKDIHAIPFNAFRHRQAKNRKESDVNSTSTSEMSAANNPYPKPVLPSISTLFSFNMFNPGLSTMHTVNYVKLNQANTNTLPPTTQNTNVFFPLIPKQVTQVPQGNPPQQPKLLQLQPQPSGRKF